VHFSQRVHGLLTYLQVEWATMLGDMPKKHPGLVSEFCHALVDDHAYYRQAYAHTAQIRTRVERRRVARLICCACLSGLHLGCSIYANVE